MYPALKTTQRSSSQLATLLLEDCKVYRPAGCLKSSLLSGLFLVVFFFVVVVPPSSHLNNLKKKFTRKGFYSIRQRRGVKKTLVEF